MVKFVTSEHWTRLRETRPQSEDALSTTPILATDSGRELLAAIDQAGNLHLLIPVEHDPQAALPPDLNGLRVRHRQLSIGPVLDLSAPPSHEQVFTPFCDEIVDAIVGQFRDPWRAVAATIRTWQSAWKPARQSMEKSVQVGLFGELLVLRTLMLPALGPVAIDQWCGPDSERHDFICSQLHIEVKTTRKSRPEHDISRLDQLRPPAEGQLLFVSIQVEESIGGDESLATQMDAIVELLRGSPAALDLFLTKMATLGWTEEVRGSGELLRFFLRQAEVFVVDDDFPRLPDDFTPPSGVVSVKYTVSLANLPSLGMDEVRMIIEAANHGSTP